MSTDWPVNENHNQTRLALCILLGEVTILIGQAMKSR